MVSGRRMVSSLTVSWWATPFSSWTRVVTGTISCLNLPLSRALAARRWLSAANASWSARLTLKRAATFSAVAPMEV